jgi:hypothetical protein
MPQSGNRKSGKAESAWRAGQLPEAEMLKSLMSEIITEQKGGSACADARPANVSRTGQRRAAAAESVPVADVESKSLSENWEGSHCNRRFRVVRVFRGRNLLQFHFWSSPVTFGHIWSCLVTVGKGRHRASAPLRLKSVVICVHLWLKTKSGKEKVKFW